MKYLLIFLLILVLFAVSITLGAYNDQLVRFNYLIAQGEYRLSTLLVLSFTIGFLLALLICSMFWLRTRFLLAGTRRKLKQLQLESVTPSQ